MSYKIVWSDPFAIELGNRYEVPLYCLVDPTNLLPDDQSEVDLGQQQQQHGDDQPCGMSSTMTHRTSSYQQPRERGHQKTISSVSSIAEPQTLHTSHRESLTETLGNSSPAMTSSSLPDSSATPGDHPITVRLSTGKDLSIKISSVNETIPLLKSRIYADANAHLNPDTHHLRLIHLGKILDDHTSIIADFTLTPTPPVDSNTVKLRAGAVIQALVVALRS